MKIIPHLRILVLGIVLAWTGPAQGQSSTPNSSLFMRITAAQQGVIKGEVTRKGREDQHSLLAYSHEIISPRDPASGLPTGKRQHQPFRIVKLLNQGSPKLLTAMKNSEILSTVVIDV